jgi:hypothetical protein
MFKRNILQLVDQIGIQFVNFLKEIQILLPLSCLGPGLIRLCRQVTARDKSSKFSRRICQVMTSTIMYHSRASSTFSSSPNWGNPRLL